MVIAPKTEGEANAKRRLTPIFEATAIPVGANSALPQQPSEPFILTVEPERAQSMSGATQDAVRHLGAASFECKALAIKKPDGSGMTLSIDRIRMGGVIVPFVCPQRATERATADLGVLAPKRGWLVHPDRYSWGMLGLAEDGLVLLIGVTTFLGLPAVGRNVAQSPSPR